MHGCHSVLICRSRCGAAVSQLQAGGRGALDEVSVCIVDENGVLHCTVDLCPAHRRLALAVQYHLRNRTGQITGTGYNRADGLCGYR